MTRRDRDIDWGTDDPLEVLGLSAGATASDIAAARRRLAKAAHPDSGGSVGRMQRVNAAATAALARMAEQSNPTSQQASSGPSPEPEPEPDRRMRHDHPSFTIEVLPVVAHQALVVVANTFGDVIDDEPPYLLEVAMIDPIRCWCRLDVVPDAGASTVSLTVAGEPGSPAPDVVVVRDLWVAELNSLEWSDSEGPRRLPS